MTAATRMQRGAETREQRLPFLDGIRGLAVLAVLLYHGGVSGVEGGLLGVDVFFVLSGFLITGLLCAEFERSSMIRLGSFWAGRARRLLPALLILLVGVGLYAALFPTSVNGGSVRGDAWSTLLYVANWHFVTSGQGYFAQAAAPSPLLHTWSLGVEEQYYLIWPLVVLFVLRLGGRRALGWVAGGGAGASAALMGAMYLAGFSTNRLYYGTDTRAQALLVGSVLGVLASHRGWRVVAPRRAVTREGRFGGAIVGGIGAAALLWAWHSVGGQDPFLYEGGFLVVALATGAVITVVTSWRESVLARVLSVRPLTFVGRISYGLYLYHWPLFLIVDHAHTGLSGAALLAARLTASFVAAVLSWRFVEEPIRRRRVLFRWRAGVWGAGAVTGTVLAVFITTGLPASAGSAPAGGGAVADRAVPPAEHAALAARHAFSTNPEHLLLLGDSLALTLRFGLRVQSVRRYGVALNYKGAWLGCDLDPTLPVIVQDRVAAGDPGCPDWQQTWPRFVEEDRPDVVGILLGRFELVTHRYRGRWVHVGDPVWDRHLAGELDTAIRLVTQNGARVALFTAPYDQPPTEAPNGSVYPENEPSRVTAYNRVLRAVAASHPGVVTLIDLNHMLDPGGQYASTIDGVRVRYLDGIHISIGGGEWLQPRLLPEIARIGLEGPVRT